MLKKSISILVILVFVMGILGGCSQKQPPPAPVKEAPKPIVMKIGHAQPEATPRHESLVKFKEIVESKSNNTIKVEIYPNAQLGKENELIEAVKMGNIQACRAGVFDAVAPELSTYLMPFLFDSVESIEKVTNGPIGERIAKNAEKNGIIILATGDAGGFRHFSNNVRPIVKPADMKGLKMRTPPVESIIKIMEALGANPVSIPYNDTYMALKTGVADGQENPFVNIASMKFHEVQKYMTVVNYQFHPDPFNVSLKWYQSLSPEHQKILKDASVEMMKISNGLMKKGNDESFEIIKKSGVKIVELTPEQKEAFVEKCKPVYDYFIKQGTVTQKDLDEIRALVKK